MRFNPLEWSKVNGQTFQAQSGQMLLRSAQPFGVEVEAFGVKAAYGFAATHSLTLPVAAKVALIGAKADVFAKDRPSRVVRMIGEKFTNMDRLPQESGTVAEVTKALRLMKLEERAMIRRIREERAISEELIEAPKRAKAEADAKAKAEADAKAKAEADAKAKAEADAQAQP